MNNEQISQRNQSLPHIKKAIMLLAFILVLVQLSFVSYQQASAHKPHRVAAQTTEKILVSITNDTTTWNDDTLYTINPADGSNKTALFDLHNQPVLKTGSIQSPRIKADGSQVYFHSDHANIYTPAGRNVFSLNIVTGLDQVTPGPESGIWGKTGNSTVSGTVEKSNGDPWINGTVYLEGMNSVSTGVDGTFRFENVPPGVRWLVAYRPTLDVFDAESITVIANLNTTGLVLVPDTDTSSRSNFEHPVGFGERIYYKSFNEIKWSDVDFAPPVTVYNSPADSCTGLPLVDAFDVGAVTGKIALYDYQTGCGVSNTNHLGLYTLDKDGNNKQLFFNMLADPNWGDPILPVEVRWSPDESRLAIKASYDNFDYLIIYDANGSIIGSAVADTTTEILTLHSWSPDGNWLLFSFYDGDPAQTTLGKIAIKSGGNFDIASIITLLANQPIRSATWGNLADASPPVTPTPVTPTPVTPTPVTPTPSTDKKVYLPLVVR